MCFVSVVMQHKYDEWYQRYQNPQPTYIPPVTPYVPAIVPMPSAQEVDEFRRLLDRAREYDKKMGQPDCELEEKRQQLRNLAETLGVKIGFV
jgi:hypothetical protein